jgi:tRNA threonylcarbamoyladenosine biosynthesis protein TsaE
MDQRHVARSETETAALAHDLASSLISGGVVLLIGDLGAGKTSFVRGLAAGLGIDPDEVSSPTFTLIQIYRGRQTLYHVDLYRLAGGEADDLGLEELAAEPGAVLAIEWAEKLPRPVAGAVVVEIDDLGEDNRAIRIVTEGTPKAVSRER